MNSRERHASTKLIESTDVKSAILLLWQGLREDEKEHLVKQLLDNSNFAHKHKGCDWFSYHPFRPTNGRPENV